MCTSVICVHCAQCAIQCTANIYWLCVLQLPADQGLTHSLGLPVKGGRSICNGLVCNDCAWSTGITAPCLLIAYPCRAAEAAAMAWCAWCAGIPAPRLLNAYLCRAVEAAATAWCAWSAGIPAPANTTAYSPATAAPASSNGRSEDDSYTGILVHMVSDLILVQLFINISISGQKTTYFGTFFVNIFFLV